MDFFTKYKRPAPVLEHPDPVSKVETQGYIPADVQIMRDDRRRASSGQFPKENFDFGSEEEVEDDFIDPTRSRDLIWLMRRSLLKASDAMERRELKRKILMMKRIQQEIKREMMV